MVVKNKAWPFQWLAPALVALVILTGGTSSLAAQTEALPELSKDFHALSLRRLGQRLAECQGSGACPKDLLELGGLKRIDGYVTDDKDGDVILIGRSNAEWPPLHVEDFVVALRNAWWKYAERRGNRILYADPGCSIDPNPAVINELNVLGQQVLSGGDQSGLDQWNRVCRKPQDVRVLGIPFHTRFAEILVQADYDMKSQVDGSDPLDIPGLRGLTTMTLELARRDVVAGRQISIPLSAMNRFWFYPGENVFEEHDGIVLILESPVTLLSHQTFVTAKNEIADAASRDPLAERFAEHFTLVYDEIAWHRPIFRQLEGLFHSVAMAKVIEHKLRETPSAAALSYFLESYPVARTKVAEQLPGRPTAEGFEHRQPVAGGVQIMTLRLPSCGGVAIAIDASEQRYHRNATGALPAFRTVALHGKAATPNVAWTIRRREDDSAKDMELQHRTRELNKGNRETAFFTVRYEEDGFKLYNSVDTPRFYEWERVDNLLRDVAAQRPSGRIYLDLYNFSADKADAFRSNFRNHQEGVNVDGSIHVVENIPEEFAHPGIEIDGEVGPIRDIKSGERIGWKERSMSFKQKFRGEAQKLLLTIRAKSQPILEHLPERFKKILGDPLTGPISPPDLIHRGLGEAKRDLPFKDDEIEFDFKKEPGKTHFVELPDVPSRKAA